MANKTIKCPSCLGQGTITRPDNMATLMRIFNTLSKPDQDEVIVYARYLARKARKAA